MGNGIYIALSGALAQSNALDVVANNLANSSTTGFRAERIGFGMNLAQAAGRIGDNDTIFSGLAKIAPTKAPGDVVQTGNPLDVALEGDGYFAVDTARGTRYTRAGNFTLNAEGKVVDASGHPLRGSSGQHITVPTDTKMLRVGADGTIQADGNDIGTLELVRFDPKLLTNDGGALFAPVPGATPLTGTPTVMSGALERSNVNSVRGVVDLVKVQRTYDALLSAIDSYREIDSRSAREIGGPK